MIVALTHWGLCVRQACLTVGVSGGGYYAWKGRVTLADGASSHLVGERDHREPQGPLVAPMARPRVTAELRFGRGVTVGHNTVYSIIKELGIKGIPNHRPAKESRLAPVASLDLVQRNFHRAAPNQLRSTNITEHPTREGKIYCCAVHNAFSRRVVRWSIDSTQTSQMVINALGMATKTRHPNGELVIHSDRGAQFTSWAFNQKVREAGLAPSMGSVGSAYDNAMMESFWGRTQVELLNRKRWKTRIDLANSIHDYIELFHNTRRRHNSLNMLTPAEYEQKYTTTTAD